MSNGLMRVSARQLEVLGVLAEFGCECWGEVWTRCDSTGLSFQNFDRVAHALVRRGFVSEGDPNGDDRLEVTATGKQALGLPEDLLTAGERRAVSRRQIAGL